jgi:membrane fusion protein, multidrug efflux system
MATSTAMAQESIPASASSSVPTKSVAAAASAAPPQPATTAAPAAKGASRRPLIIGAAVSLVAVAGLLYWLHARHFEETDDAQIDGTISNVSPRVSGNVSAVYVVENQSVKLGDVLAEIDPEDLRISVEQARASVALAQAQLEAEDPNVPMTLATNESQVASAGGDLAAAQAALSAARSDVQQLSAQLDQAEANDRTVQLDKGRSEKLIAQGAVAQADFDQHMNAAIASRANVDALRQSLAAAKDRVTQQVAQLVAFRSHLTEIQANAPRHVATQKASVIAKQASLDLANAQLAQANRNLAYAKIISPVTGIVAKKAIAVGDHVAPGQEVVAISDSSAFWVTANFRETQLEAMHPGQPARIHVDALDADLHGVVESIGGATGARLSVFPPENAAGNFVKVVQRIPVRIKLDPGQSGFERLRIGMSAEPEVTVR